MTHHLVGGKHWHITKPRHKVECLTASMVLLAEHLQARLPPRFFRLAPSAAEHYDFAVITLPAPLGKQTGWLGLRWSNDTLSALNLTITGVRL